MGKEEEPPSFTGPAPPEQGEGGGEMEDLVEQLKRQKGGATETGDTGTETGSTSASTGTGKRKKKKKAKKVKRKRRKDRYESQNYLLRIEGTLCCASLIIGFVWLVSVFIALIAFLVWAEFDVTATTDSVK
ncbi:hypothetical protein RB195_007713 [Necator americanus]|uniref:Uncharacterized protein n=1 Tax=Necator americanus TaxID=51031 RepID=A0ABR1C171_NECAM